MTTFGTSAAYIATCMKAGVEPREGRDLGALRAVGSTGSPLSPEGFDWVYEHVGSRHVAVLDQRRHRRVHRVRRRRADPARLRRRAAGPGAGRQGRGLRRGRQRAHRRGRRARGDRADAVDADRLLERRRRLAAARELLLDVPGRLAPRRLDRDHRARHGDHLRPLGLDHQPRRRAHGHERDLPRGAGRRGRRRRAGRRRAARGTEGWMPLFVVLRDGATLDDDLVARIRGASARTARRATCPTRSTSHRGGAAHAVGQGARGAGQADPHGRPAEKAASRESLANPEALDYFVELADGD